MKPPFFADRVQALSWGLITGFNSPFPWFYVAFFTPMILHRAYRDTQKCREKYGDAWVEYERQVPYLFIPVSDLFPSTSTKLTPSSMSFEYCHSVQHVYTNHNAILSNIIGKIPRNIAICDSSKDCLTMRVAYEHNVGESLWWLQLWTEGTSDGKKVGAMCGRRPLSARVCSCKASFQLVTRKVNICTCAYCVKPTVDMLINESHQDVPTTADGKGSMRKALPINSQVLDL